MPRLHWTRRFRPFPQLAARRRQRAGTLSGGEQRMLSLVSALVELPALLVVDELSLGLAPVVIDEVFRDAGVHPGCRYRPADRGATHDRALSLADEVVLLSKGEVVRHGPVDELRDLVTSSLGL